MKYLFLIFALAITIFSVACGSSGPANANSNVNANKAMKLDTANMPPGLNPEPIQPSGNSTPGIPSAITNLPKGATPTPGIPDPATLKRGIKPGVTPTPGIPSPEEIKKAMQQHLTNSNGASTVNDQMMKKTDSGDQMMRKNTNKIQKP
jgi:hypothetical protein